MDNQTKEQLTNLGITGAIIAGGGWLINKLFGNTRNNPDNITFKTVKEITDRVEYDRSERRWYPQSVAKDVTFAGEPPIGYTRNEIKDAIVKRVFNTYFDGNETKDEIIDFFLSESFKVSDGEEYGLKYDIDW